MFCHALKRIFRVKKKMLQFKGKDGGLGRGCVLPSPQNTSRLQIDRRTVKLGKHRRPDETRVQIAEETKKEAQLRPESLSAAPGGEQRYSAAPSA